jgi:Zn-dependent protease
LPARPAVQKIKGAQFISPHGSPRVFFGVPQPTPFDLNWRMFGIDVRVHPFFWLTSVFLGWNWYLISNNIAYLLLWVLCVFVSVLIHEMGHVLMGRVFGSHGSILLYGFGGLALGSNNLRERWQRVLVLFAGPFAQLVLFGLVLGAAFFVLPAVLTLAPAKLDKNVISLGVFMLLEINLLWALLNLIPIFPLDGGQITREVLEGFMGQRGVIIACGISLGVAAVLALQMFYPFIPYFPFGDPLMGIFLVLMAVSSYQMMQMEMNRRPRYYEDDRLPWE